MEAEEGKSQYLDIYGYLVPGLEVGLAILIREEEAAAELGQLVRGTAGVRLCIRRGGVAGEQDGGGGGGVGGPLDQAGVRHQEAALCVDAGQHRVLGAGDAVLAGGPGDREYALINL